MSDVFMCDCCEDVLDIDLRNKVVEYLIAWDDNTEFEAEDDICDHCLEEILKQVGYVEEDGD